MGYRIPKEQISCKFDRTEYDYVPVPFGHGNCPMPTWECRWFEEAPENPEVATAIDKLIDTPNFQCSPKCPGYQPCETTICPKHDSEHYTNEQCGDCEEAFYSDMKEANP